MHTLCAVWTEGFETESNPQRKTPILSENSWYSRGTHDLGELGEDWSGIIERLVGKVGFERLANSTEHDRS
jgi:hypothetical protein